jgi:integrase
MAIDRTGITQTPSGWRIYVRVRPLPPATARFPPGTPQRVLIEARDAMKARLRKQRNDQARLAVPAGTFAADAARYLKAVAAMKTYADRAWQIGLWVEHFGAWRRPDITAADIRTVLAAWASRYSPRTLNHLRGALMHLWHVLDGKAERNPVRDVPAARLPDELPRNLPLGAADAILSHISESKARAVLRLMMATGMTPTEIQRIERSDVLPDALIARGRRKGKGTRPRALPLTPAVRDALEEFIVADAWGGVTVRTAGKAWRLAREKAGYGDTGWKAYDLRHTYLTDIAAAGDDRVVMYLAGHSTPKMGHRYTLGSVPARVAEVVATVVAKRVDSTIQPRTILNKSADPISAHSGGKTGENARESRRTTGER